MIRLLRVLSCNRGAAHRWHAGEIRVRLPAQRAEVSRAASRWITLPLPGEPLLPNAMRKGHLPPFSSNASPLWVYIGTFPSFSFHCISKPNLPSICRPLLLLVISVRNVKKCHVFFFSLRLRTSGQVPGGLPPSSTMVMSKTGVKMERKIIFISRHAKNLYVHMSFYK